MSKKSKPTKPPCEIENREQLKNIMDVIILLATEAYDKKPQMEGVS